MKDPFLSILFHLHYLVSPVIVFVMVLKLVLFASYKTSSCGYANLVYFDSDQIIDGQPSDKVNVKIIQNALTFYFVFLIVFDIFLLICFPVQ